MEGGRGEGEEEKEDQKFKIILSCNAERIWKSRTLNLVSKERKKRKERKSKVL